MMNFKTTISEEEKQQIFEAYTSSFPAEERRNDDDFWKLFDNPNTEILSINDGQKFVGYFVIWHLSDFVFVEHFEIFESFRGQNLGTMAIEFLRQNYPFLILETEPKILNKTAEKRVKFYQKNGFSILKKDYIQPSYGEGKPSVNLWLMGNFSPKNIEKSIDEIYRMVYSSFL